MNIWSEMFNSDCPPTDSQTENFVNSALWEELNTFLREKYSVKTQCAYSTCPMQNGWNYKYKLKSKALCTLYPQKDFFITLVVIGEKEESRVQAVLPLMTEYTRQLYGKTPPIKKMGRWLMIKVADINILNDVKELISIKATSV